MESSETKRPRGRPKTINADDLRDVAMNAYWKGEPADISVNAICKLAGTSKPSLYRAFGSEDGLTLSVIEHYATLVLGDVFAILNGRLGLNPTLDALISFACDDTRMETGCLFYKMRAGKIHLGPATRARVEELDANAEAAFLTFVQRCCEAGDWPAGLSAELGARYLSEQLALAIGQRARGCSPATIRDMMTLAFQPLRNV